jgi:hypothetical protein
MFDVTIQIFIKCIVLKTSYFTVRKAVLMAELGYYQGICLEGIEKTVKNLITMALSAEDQPERLLVVIDSLRSVRRTWLSPMK